MISSYFIFFPFNLRLFATTEIELKAIVAPAIIGLRRKPETGNSTPAAMGIASTLYPNAQNRFC